MIPTLKISNFYKSIGVLLSGTAIAQVITIAILPILTRLYTPDELGILAVFTAIVAVFLSVSCFRFEMAIPIQKAVSDANNVLALCLVTVGLNFIFSVLICSILYLYFPIYLGEVEGYIFLVPFSILIGGVYLSINSYSIREKKFLLISKSRLIQSSSCALIQISGGVFGIGPLALLVGYIVNLGAGLFFLKKRVVNGFDVSSMFSLKLLKKTFLKNINFPKYSVPESFSNTVGIQIPILIIASSIGIAEAGYMFLAMRIMQAPMSLLGSSISQVYYSQAAISYQSGDLKVLTLKVVNATFKIGVGPILFVAIISPSFINVVLGSDWSKVGDYMFLMSPWFIFQFLASPISTVMYTVGKQREFMFITMIGCLFKVMTVCVAVYSGSYIVESFVLANSLFYLVCFIRFSFAGDITFYNLYNLFNKNLYSPIAFSVLAILLSIFLKGINYD